MWVCKECNAENGDSSHTCATCGQTKGFSGAKATTNYTSASSGSKKQRTFHPDQRICEQAIALEDWGNRIFIISLILGVIALILSGITTGIGQTLLPEMTFKFSNMLLGLVPLVCWIGGGYIFKIVANAVAIIVEASYRSMFPKDPE